MAVFMTQFSYTTEAWQTMVKNPQDRSGVLKGLVEKLGGTLIGLYFCMGDYDGVALYEYPDDLTCAGGALAVISAGHLKTIKTTKLLSVDEMVGAMKKAGGIVYPGPKG